jgi:hypothetical protein
MTAPGVRSRTRADLLLTRFGVATASHDDPLVAVLPAVPTAFLGLNPNRLAFLIVNLSAGPIYIKPKPDVAATSGIVLAANGGSAAFVYDEDFDLVGMEWYGLGAGAGSDIYVEEVVAL